MEDVLRRHLFKLRTSSDKSSEDKIVSDLQQIVRGRNVGARGLCIDVLTAISPILTRARIHGDGVHKLFWEMPQKAVLGALVQCGSREATEACARWLLRGKLHLENAVMECEGMGVPCSEALDALACYIMGGRSVAWEGYWDEGGGSDVNETKTWREHSQSFGCIITRHVSADECIALAHYIVCEGANSGDGEISMGRMQLLLEAVGFARENMARKVGDELVTLLAKLAQMVSHVCAIHVW